jgi:glycosyltransferase involved in cell wall biosynthesis
MVRHHGDQKSGQVVFAYSYAARQIFRTARELGCITVLGQIDPGPTEERIVAEICRRRGNHWQRVPESYWDAWREECDLCDSIVVNSEWTRKALITEGVPTAKIHVVPVAYDPPEHARQLKRTYPNSFNASRPLRVLFLGSLIPRKGIHEMLDAVALMKTAQVEFRFVGALGVEFGIELAESTHVHWTGPVARKRVHDFYSNADVFILPTHSDGFGLTQVEAMAWGLPVIASNNCGDVVKHEVNGLILPTVTAEAIAESINWCIKNVERLGQMSDCAIRTSGEFRAHHVVSQLLHCAESREPSS